jgi:hypothetical protein
MDCIDAIHSGAPSTTPPLYIGTSGCTSWWQLGQETGAINQRAIARRSAGSVGTGMGRLRLEFFFAQPHMLQEGKCDHCEQCVMVQTMPRSAFKMV